MEALDRGLDRGILDGRDFGREGFWTGGILDRRDFGQEGFWTGGILDRRDFGREGFGFKGLKRVLDLFWIEGFYEGV